MSIFDGHEGSSSLNPNYIISRDGQPESIGAPVIDTGSKLIGQNCVEIQVHVSGTQYVGIWRDDVKVKRGDSFTVFFKNGNTSWKVAPTWHFGGPNKGQSFIVNFGNYFINWCQIGYTDGTDTWGASKQYTSLGTSVISHQAAGGIVQIDITWNQNDTIDVVYRKYEDQTVLTSGTITCSSAPWFTYELGTTGGGFGFKNSTGVGGADTYGLFDGYIMEQGNISIQINSLLMNSLIETKIPMMFSEIGAPVLTGWKENSNIKLDW